MSAIHAPSNGLSLRALAKSFAGRMALADLTLDVALGEVVCLLGPSGCGKSTTLRIAAGLERPDRGTVFVGSRLVEGEGRHVPPEQRGVGLMFQDYALFPHLTVAGNVAFGLAGLSRAERAERAADEIARVGLAPLANAYPHTLSGGEQQRVALARMLAPRPQAVLMDEPFSGLDAQLREEVRQRTLSRLRAAGAAVLIVTHDPEEALRIGDRIALMRAGRIVQQGTPGEIFRTPADVEAAALFGGVNVFHAVVRGGRAVSPFGEVAAGNVGEGAWAEILIRPSAIVRGETGPGARVLATRPIAGRIEVEAELLRDAAPEGAETPRIIRFVPGDGAALKPGDEIRLAADLGQALVFPCQNAACRG